MNKLRFNLTKKYGSLTFSRIRGAIPCRIFMYGYGSLVIFLFTSEQMKTRKIFQKYHCESKLH